MSVVGGGMPALKELALQLERVLKRNAVKQKEIERLRRNMEKLTYGWNMLKYPEKVRRKRI